MGPFDTAVATLLVALPTVAVPLHGAFPVASPVHGVAATVIGLGNLLVDTVVGVAVGVALVGVYLAVLRWTRGESESDSRAESARNGQRQDS